jgi:hypothetical protein
VPQSLFAVCNAPIENTRDGHISREWLNTKPFHRRPFRESQDLMLQFAISLKGSAEESSNPQAGTDRDYRTPSEQSRTKIIDHAYGFVSLLAQSTDFKLQINFLFHSPPTRAPVTVEAATTSQIETSDTTSVASAYHTIHRTSQPNPQSRSS